MRHRFAIEIGAVVWGAVGAVIALGALSDVNSDARWAVGIASVVAFGSHAGGFLTELRTQQDQVAFYSVPNQVGRLLGFDGLTIGIRLVADAAFLATLVVGLRRAWRGGDWIAAVGWATFALVVTSAWLLPWYVVWLLPLAAVSGDRRLRAAALALTAYIVVTRVTLWASLPG